MYLSLASASDLEPIVTHNMFFKFAQFLNEIQFVP